MKKRQASILIMCLGILAVLSILAVSFSQLMRVERKASLNWREKTRAGLLAQAGIERAIQAIRNHFKRKATLSVGDPLVYGDYNQPATGRNYLETPLERSVFPSLGLGTIRIGGRSFSYSGYLDLTGTEFARAFPRQGLHYVLEVQDLSTTVNLAALDVNRRNPSGNVLLLNNLGKILKDRKKFERSPQGKFLEKNHQFAEYDDQMGTYLQSSRFNYRNLDEVRRVLDSEYGVHPRDFELLGHYISFHSFGESAHRQSVDQPLAMTADPHGPGATGTVHPEYSRWPLNVNAAPRALLIAALLRIAADYTDHKGNVHVVEVPESVAILVADKIMSRREVIPFSGWQDFYQFIASLTLDSDAIKDAGLKQVILANANPSARLARFNLDAFMRYLDSDGHLAGGEKKFTSLMKIDKAQLTRYTVEFGFVPHGAFRIQSLGRVVDAAGEILARHFLTASVKVYEQVRLFSQQHFTRLRSRSAGTDTWPESLDHGKPAEALARASRLDGRIRLDDTFRAEGTLLFASPKLRGFSARFSKAGDETFTSNMNDASVFTDGDRVADGVFSRLDRQRHVHYPTQGHMDVDGGAVEFWFKVDEKTIDPDRNRSDGALFASVHKIPNPSYDSRVTRVAYIEKGMLKVAQSFSTGVDGVARDVNRTVIRRKIVGQQRPDAFDVLKRDGMNWLAATKDSARNNRAYLEAFGKLFAKEILHALSQGGTKKVSTYIYDAERAEGLGHIGCVTRTVEVESYIPKVFQGTASVSTVTESVEKYLLVVREIAQVFNFENRLYDSSGVPQATLGKFLSEYENKTKRALANPYEASRIAREVDIRDWKPGEWHHVQILWEKGTGFMRLFVDGIEQTRIAEIHGPLEIFRSRLWRDEAQVIKDRFFAGGFSVNVARLDGGTVRAEKLTMVTDGTLADFRSHARRSDLPARDRFATAGAASYTLRINSKDFLSGRPVSFGTLMVASYIPHDPAGQPRFVVEATVKGTARGSADSVSQSVDASGRMPERLDPARPIDVELAMRLNGPARQPRSHVETPEIDEVILTVFTPDRIIDWIEVK